MYSVLFFCCYSFSVKFLLPEWWFCYWGSTVVSHFVGYCLLCNTHRARLRCKGPTNTLVHCTLHITVHIHEISLIFFMELMGSFRVTVNGHQSLIKGITPKISRLCFCLNR